MALLAASLFPQLNRVVAVMGSCYVYPGLKGNIPSAKSSWSYQGKDVPSLRYGIGSCLKMLYRQAVLKDKYAMQKLAHDSFAREKERKRAQIVLEKIRGKILFITSAEDTVWPSKEYGEAAAEYLKER